MKTGGSGRFSGGLGVAVVTYGAGEAKLGRGLHHQVKRLDSQYAICREVSCAQTVLTDPTAPAEIARVLDAAKNLSRPVHIELPRDLVNAPARRCRRMTLVGDGAFQMTGRELGNCRKYGWAPIVIVFNNRSREMLRAFQPGPSCHDFDDWHHAAIAEHLGGAACG